MVNPRSLERVAEAAEAGPRDTVLEIGAGLGFLTERLASRSGRVVAVERDKRFCEYLRGRFAASPNVEIVEADILELPFGRFDPGEGIKFAGNIPYQISSPLLEKLEHHRALVRDAVLTVQKDFALRLGAREGSRDRSALAAWFEMNARIEVLAHFPRTDFYPAPEVRSSLVRVRFRPSPLVPAECREWVRRAIGAGFGQKRKNILNALAGSALEGSKAEFAALLRDAAIAAERRAEDLSAEEWIRLGRLLAARNPAC